MPAFTRLVRGAYFEMCTSYLRLDSDVGAWLALGAPPMHVRGSMTLEMERSMKKDVSKRHWQIAKEKMDHAYRVYHEKSKFVKLVEQETEDMKKDNKQIYFFSSKISI